MSASYPGAVKSFSTKLAGQTISAAHVNDLQDEVVAVESALLNGVDHTLKPASAGSEDLGSVAVPWGNLFANGLKLTDATTLTLATDAATVIHSYHALDTEGAAAGDSCATLTAGTGVAAGFILIVRAANVAHVVTMKDGTGNLLLNGDYDLGTTDATMMLIYDGTNWRELARSISSLVSSVTLLDKSTTEQSVDTTNVATSVYSFSVLGGKLSTNKTLKLTITGEYTNTSGGASTLSVTGTYGATTFCSGSLTNFASSTTGGFELVVHINANGATNSQRAVSVVKMVPSGSAPGNGVFTSSGLVNVASHNAMTEDSTAAKTLEVKVTHATSASTIKFKRFAAVLELLG